ncbi:unnamed protein product [Caenorhabditis nigoni]
MEVSTSFNTVLKKCIDYLRNDSTKEQKVDTRQASRKLVQNVLYIPPVKSKGFDFEAPNAKGVVTEFCDPMFLAFEGSEQGHKTTVTCVLDHMHLYKPLRPPSMCMRCMCSRSGCNIL